MPTSLSLRAALAVERFVKLIQAITRIKAASAVNRFTYPILSPACVIVVIMIVKVAIRKLNSNNLLRGIAGVGCNDVLYFLLNVLMSVPFFQQHKILGSRAVPLCYPVFHGSEITER